MKEKVVILFGGQSSEHDVSCISATTVIKNMSDKYEQYLVGITKDGKWLNVDSVGEIEDGTWCNSTKRAILSPDATRKELLIMEKGEYKSIKVDVIFPVLHGLHGEDGTVQGIFELARFPYVGCGVLASSVSMDKLHTKVIVDRLDIEQAQYVDVRRNELHNMDMVVVEVENTLDYPVFIKPSQAGSSKGVSKADNREELIAGLQEAAKHDFKILVEEAIVGREIECGVLGNAEPKASGVGEILKASEAVFYDFDAKYNNAESKTVIGPQMPKEVEQEVREAAIAIFKAVDGRGLARVDFFVEKGTNRVVFNEINTLPGFTAISMYPMLWEAKGLSKTELIDELIALAKTRYDD